MAFLGWVLIAVIRIYIILLTVRIFISWLNLPHSSFLYWLERVTDPVLNYFKKVFPVRIGFLDLSPLVPLLLLGLADNVVYDLFVMKATFGVAYILRLFIYIIRFIFNIFIFILGFSSVVLLIMSFISPYTYNPVVTMIRSFLDPVMSRLRRILRIHSFYSDRIYLVILLVLIMLTSVAGNFLLDFINFDVIGKLRF